MTAAQREEQLSDTPMVGIRLGALRPRVESVCKQWGIDMSEFIRKAIERELDQDAYKPYGVCFGASSRFYDLLKAARSRRLVSSRLTNALEDALIEFRAAIYEKLEESFFEEHPGVNDREHALMEKHKEWENNGEKGPEPPTRAPETEQWIAQLNAYKNFSDLERAAEFLRSLPGSGQSQI